MLDQIMPGIVDGEDYVTALSLYHRTAPLTAEQAEALLDVYLKYIEEVDDREYARLFLAVDLMSGDGENDEAELEAVGLAETDRDALFRLRELVAGPEWTRESAQDVVDLVQDGTLSEPMRVALARGALDSMVRGIAFMKIRVQIKALAEYLIGCGPELLDKYTPLVREVYQKCRS